MGFLGDSNANVAASMTAFRALMLQALAAPSGVAKKLAMQTNSSSREEVYAFLTSLPSWRKWLDERAIEKAAATGLRIPNEKFAWGLEIERTDLEDDNLGLYGPMIQAGADVGPFLDQKLFTLLLSGFTALGYDGVPFFSTSHGPPVAGGGGPATQSNKATASLDDSGALNTAIVTLMKLKDPAGNPLAIRPTHLFVGPDNRDVAIALLGAEFLVGGASNTDYKAVELVVTPYIPGEEWFLADLSKPLRPMILQERQAPRSRIVDGATDNDNFLRGASSSYETFLRDKVYIGADARYGFGFGFWQLVYGSNGTT